MVPATRAGLRYGLILGGLSVFNHTLEMVGGLGPTLSAARGVAMWVLTFFFFGMASRRVSDRVATIPVGMAASGLNAVVSTGILVAYAVTPAAVRSQPLPAPTVASTGLRHLAGSVAIAFFVAAIGGCIASALPPTGRISLAFAGGCATVLLGAALASIVHASFLERSQRPPFIAFGLPTLATKPLVEQLNDKRRQLLLTAQTHVPSELDHDHVAPRARCHLLPLHTNLDQRLLGGCASFALALLELGLASARRGVSHIPRTPGAAAVFGGSSLSCAAAINRWVRAM
jgi:hypothetical protein